MPQFATKPEELRNTLRLSGDALSALHDAVVASENDTGRRAHERYPFRKTVLAKFPSTGSVPIPLASHDLSTGGIGFLHSAYVHSGAECVVMLPNRYGQYTVAEGVVSRCSHFRGLVHLLGVKFHKPINVRQHIALDPHKGEFLLGAVEPSTLTGTVLVVDDAEMDRKLIAHYLRATRLKVVTVDSVNAAVEAGKATPFDAVIVDFDLPERTGDTLAGAFESMGLHAPIILVSAHPAVQIREIAKHSKVAAALTKPFSEETLHRALGEFLLLRKQELAASGEAVVCSLPPGSAEAALVPDFVQRLHQLADALSAALAKHDLQSVRRLALNFKGSAKMLGFEPIAAAIASVESGLNASGSLEETGPSIRGLIGLCRRAQLRTASAA